MKETLDLLMAQYGEHRSISKVIRELQEDFSPTHKKTLEHAVGLAYYFYVQSDELSARKIVEVMSEFPFDGDYNHWVWIRSALALHARISRVNGDLRINEELISKIWGAFDIGDAGRQRVNKKVFIRSLDGRDIGFDKVTACMEDGDTISEVNYRFSCLRKMILIREVGASETYTIEQAEKDIEDNMIAIKKLLCSVDVKKILPFSDM
ncbi:DUF6707 family protein [Salmonella enterica]